MSSAEITKWMAFYSVSPFGDTRADFRIAQLTSLFANVHRDRNEKKTPYDPIDFMPYSERPEKTKEGLIKRIRNMFNG
jgi:hypothetical protein